MTRPYEQLYYWPNVLTIVRILLIPLLVLVYYLPVWWAHLGAAIIFTIASLTDWLDGYLARYLEQMTKLGAFLDPVADKLMVATALILIVAEPTFRFMNVTTSIISIPTVFITIPAGIIVSREIIVSALREWMAELGKRKSVAVTHLGKIKTALQMIALVIMLYCDNSTNATLVIIGYLFLYIAVVLTVWSMFYYLKAAWEQLLLAND